MKFATAIVVVTLCVSDEAPAGGGEKSQPRFSKKSCGDGKDPKALKACVLKQLHDLPQEEADEIAARAAKAELQQMMVFLPEWCAGIPPSILLYVAFDAGDSKFQRAYKFERLALLVRDMYEDFDINYNVLLTLPSQVDNRMSFHARQKYVGFAFLAAYDLLNQLREETGSRIEDDIASLLEMGYWGVYHMRLAQNHDDDFQLYLSAMNNLAATVLAEDPRPAVLVRARNLFSATSTNVITLRQLATALAGLKAMSVY